MAAPTPTSRTQFNCIKALARLPAWAVMAAGLAALVWLHPQLDQYLDLEATRILDRRSFRFAHRWYLWVSTVQWGAAIVYILLTLLAWRRRGVGAGADAGTLTGSAGESSEEAVINWSRSRRLPRRRRWPSMPGPRQPVQCV